MLVGFAAASHVVSAAVLPASTLLSQPHSVAHIWLEPLPEVTAYAALEPRQTPVNSICGYWSANGSSEKAWLASITWSTGTAPVSTLSRETDVSCLFRDINQTAAIGYCFNGFAPVTAIFDYGACRLAEFRVDSFVGIRKESAEWRDTT
jgi:hypothetical protein